MGLNEQIAKKAGQITKEDLENCSKFSGLKKMLCVSARKVDEEGKNHIGDKE